MLVGRHAAPSPTAPPPARDCDDPELPLHARHDQAAFTTLFDCFWPLLHRYCFGHLRSWADAEDVAQTAFVKAHQALARGGYKRRPGGGFASWLLRIAHNEAVSALRARSRRPTIPFPEERADAEATMADPGPEPAEIAEAIALNDWLADLVDRLPAGQREVVRLRLLGRTTEEIAAALGMRPGAVRKADERALKRLQELTRDAREGTDG